MQCQRCGKELGNSLRCSFCGYENSDGNVREMTQIEKNFFNGETIDADDFSGSGSNSRGSRSGYNWGNFGKRRVYVNFGSGGPGIFSRFVGNILNGLLNNSLLAKIIATLIFVALLALMFFIALPLMFLMIAIGAALFVVAQLKR